MQFECSLNPGIFVERREWNGERSQPLFFNSSVYLLMSSSHVFHESWIQDIFSRNLIFHFFKTRSPNCLFVLNMINSSICIFYFNRELLPFRKTKLLFCLWHETTKPRILLPPFFLSLNSWKRKLTFYWSKTEKKKTFLFSFSTAKTE